MIEIDILPGAQRDIRKARRWYNKQRPGLGNEFIDEVEPNSRQFVKLRSFILYLHMMQDGRHSSDFLIPSSIT